MIYRTIREKPRSDAGLHRYRAHPGTSAPHVMNDPEPLYLTDLFPWLDAMLIELLRGLSDEEWGMPTICSLWGVKDIAAHLLDGNIRRLSMMRDGYSGVPAEGIDSHGALVDYLN